MAICLKGLMVKQKRSRRKGIMTESETRFLFMNEEEKRKNYADSTIRKFYERIVGSASQGFQDYNIIIARLPERHVKKIEFILGLQNIEKALTKKGLSDLTTHRIIETT